MRIKARISPTIYFESNPLGVFSHLAVKMTPGVVDIPIPTPARAPKVRKRTWIDGANAEERIPKELRREPTIVT